jgi:hypothetical protein
VKAIACGRISLAVGVTLCAAFAVGYLRPLSVQHGHIQRPPVWALTCARGWIRFESVITRPGEYGSVVCDNLDYVVVKWNRTSGAFARMVDNRVIVGDVHHIAVTSNTDHLELTRPENDAMVTLDSACVTSVEILAWPVAFPFLAYAVIVFRRKRTRQRALTLGHCLCCDYDLAGNTSGVCPECGERA